MTYRDSWMDDPEAGVLVASPEGSPLDSGASASCGVSALGGDASGFPASALGDVALADCGGAPKDCWDWPYILNPKKAPPAARAITAAAATANPFRRCFFGVDDVVLSTSTTRVGADVVVLMLRNSADPVPSRPPSAAAKSLQLGYRFADRFARARAKIASRPANSGFRSLTSGGSSMRCWAMRTAGLESS